MEGGSVNALPPKLRFVDLRVLDIHSGMGKSYHGVLTCGGSKNALPL